MSLLKRKDLIFLFVPGIIGGIVILSIWLLDIQLLNFQEAYFREVAEETRRNNFFLVQAFQDLLEANELDKMHRIINGFRGPDPMIVRIVAQGQGPVMETESAPGDLARRIRDPEIREIFRENRDEEVTVTYDRTLKTFMIYHAVRFPAGGRNYALLMAAKCNSMTLLMRQTQKGILILTVLGVVSSLALAVYFAFWVRSPLNRLFASISRIAAGELDFPVYVPRRGLIREIALCLKMLTEQLKKQIVSLRDGANERETILNSLTEAVLLTDASGRVSRWNRTAGELFFLHAAPEAAAKEETGAEKKPGMVEETREYECPAELRSCVQCARESGSYSGELKFIRDEREYQLLVHVVSFYREGRQFFLISATDLSEIRKLENDRREFIAAISHEMKTPLTGIVGAVDAINNGALENAEYKERCIETLNSQSERLHLLLVNFLTLSALENMPRAGENTFLPFSARSLVRSSVELCRSAAEAAEIELVLTHCDSCEIQGDELLLQQALNNLIENAIHHSGTCRIEVSANLRSSGAELDFCVRDYGCGIAPEHQARIFKRFYRVPGGRNRRQQQGNGIGLAIVKHVALYHYGTVSVFSRPGEGAEFHIVLPLRPGH